MEEREVLIPNLRHHFGCVLVFSLLIKEEETVCKICCTKVPVKSANVTNLNQRRQIQHPQQHAELSLDVQISLNCSSALRCTLKYRMCMIKAYV